MSNVTFKFDNATVTVSGAATKNVKWNDAAGAYLGQVWDEKWFADHAEKPAEFWLSASWSKGGKNKSRPEFNLVAPVVTENIETPVEIAPVPENKAAKTFRAMALVYVEPKKMDEQQKAAHLNIRDMFRDIIAEAGAESVAKATPQVLQGAIEQVAFRCQMGQVSNTLCPAEQVVVCAWSLRHEIGKVAKFRDCNVTEATEEYVIGNFDFAANLKVPRKSKKPVDAENLAPVAPKVKAVKEVTPKAETAPRAEKTASEPKLNVIIPKGYTVRHDLTAQLAFEPTDTAETVTARIESWEKGGTEFFLMSRSSGQFGKVLKSAESKKSQNAGRWVLSVYKDEEGPMLFKSLMDVLDRYMVVIEKTA
jgi:hypothetical protein